MMKRGAWTPAGALLGAGLATDLLPALASRLTDLALGLAGASLPARRGLLVDATYLERHDVIPRLQLARTELIWWRAAVLTSVGQLRQAPTPMSSRPGT